MARRYALSGEVVFRPEGEAGIVFFPADGRIESLNPVGAAVLRCVEQGMDEDGAVRRVVEAFDTDEASARRDVEAFLEDLLRRGVLRRTG